jgi:hypothetical protein
MMQQQRQSLPLIAVVVVDWRMHRMDAKVKRHLTNDVNKLQFDFRMA